MNYRHGFHAGNFADILKHTVFIHMLEYMTQKEKPLRIIDTHAGAGVYKLNGPQAQKNREFDTGIGRLWTSAPPPAALARHAARVTWRTGRATQGRLTQYS